MEVVVVAACTVSVSVPSCAIALSEGVLLARRGVAVCRGRISARGIAVASQMLVIATEAHGGPCRRKNAGTLGMGGEIAGVGSQSSA